MKRGPFSREFKHGAVLLACALDGHPHWRRQFGGKVFEGRGGAVAHVVISGIWKCEKLVQVETEPRSLSRHDHLG